MSENNSFTIVFNESMSRIDDAHAQLVFYWLCSFRNSLSNLCCPSISTLCKKSHLSRNTVKRATKYLYDLKIIEKLNHRGECNKYTIKDNKNKMLAAKLALTGTSAPQGLGRPPQGLAIISNNNTNKNTTTNYPPPLSLELRMV